jgi:hypothetical protein
MSTRSAHIIEPTALLLATDRARRGGGREPTARSAADPFHRHVSQHASRCLIFVNLRSRRMPYRNSCRGEGYHEQRNALDPSGGGSLTDRRGDEVVDERNTESNKAFVGTGLGRPDQSSAVRKALRTILALLPAPRNRAQLLVICSSVPRFCRSRFQSGTHRL